MALRIIVRWPHSARPTAATDLGKKPSELRLSGLRVQVLAVLTKRITSGSWSPFILENVASRSTLVVIVIPPFICVQLYFIDGIEG
jgi:hypothetical protein